MWRLRHQFYTKTKIKGVFTTPFFVILRVIFGATPENMFMKGKISMKKIKKLEKYLITPNVNFYGGFIFDGEDIDLCDDRDYEEGYRVHIRQKIENSVLVTRLEKEYERNNGLKVKEKSYMEVELEKGQLLVYVQGTGFVIPEYKLCTVDEAVNLMSILKGE